MRATDSGARGAAALVEGVAATLDDGMRRAARDAMGDVTPASRRDAEEAPVGGGRDEGDEGWGDELD